MKPSHLVTPRTMNEGVWTPGYGFAKEEPRYCLADRVVMWTCAFAAVCVVLIVLFTPEVPK